MINEVKQLGLEKFAGDEELADRFVAGFVAHIMMEKEAADRARPETVPPRFDRGGQKVGDPFSYSHELSKSVVENIGRGVGGLAVSVPVTAAIGAFRFVTDEYRHTRFLRALAQAISSSDILRHAPKEKVERYADTIYKFAPLVATDPNLLQSVLTNAVHGDGVDITTIKSLTDLEGRFRDNGAIHLPR